jgi:hypothetical protein
MTYKKFNQKACLRLYYFTSSSIYSSLILFAKKIPKTSLYTLLTLTNINYQTKINDKIVNLHSAFMKRCSFIFNKSLH